MRVITKVAYKMLPGGGLELVACEGYDYSGPIALAGRSESKQAFQQSSAQSAADQANAQSALAATNKGLADYSSTLRNFLHFGRTTYGQNGEFARTQNALANTTAAAGTTNLAGNLALQAMRSGENTAGYGVEPCSLQH